MTLVRVNNRWDLEVPDHRAGHWERNPFWEPARIESMAANVRPGMVVYDIGAEQGDISALLASWIRVPSLEPSGVLPARAWEPSGYLGGVVLVEPGPWYWPTIHETFLLNDLPAPLGSLCGFVADTTWHEKRVIDGWPMEAHGPMTGLEAFSNVVEHPELPRVTVDWLAANVAPPDAITMDVEGAEILVARGAQRTLAEHRPLVWVSVHAEAMFHDHGVYQVEFHSEFHRNGYEKVFLDFDHEAHWLFYPSERRAEVVLP